MPSGSTHWQSRERYMPSTCKHHRGMREPYPWCNDRPDSGKAPSQAAEQLLRSRQSRSPTSQRMSQPWAWWDQSDSSHRSSAEAHVRRCWPDRRTRIRGGLLPHLSDVVLCHRKHFLRRQDLPGSHYNAGYRYKTESRKFSAEPEKKSTSES